MLVSARWINDYLDPEASPEEQAELLTRAGFPLEGREAVEDDVRQDFEMTSNRGDCVCHVGLAREIAAISGRTLRVPEAAPVAGGPAASAMVGLTNREPELCPLYTARVVRGVRVGPSPEWLAARLRARGDIPRNNLVDLTNFVLFELGQPTHIFDLATLAGPEIVVRRAKPGEPFLPIGEGAASVSLSEEDLVIADRDTAVALAGVKGGAPTAVTEKTTDILIEAATFAPVAVRNMSRRHNIASDSSYRFERGVHAGRVDAAARRLTQLILELCGGELCDGVLAAGAPIASSRRVSMRTDRCRAVIGVEIGDEQMMDALARLGFAPTVDGTCIHCIVPLERLDIEREIDLIEEVSRMFGHDNIPVTETLQIRVAPPQPTVMAGRAVGATLAGMGFVEAVTHSLIGEAEAAPFLPAGCDALRIESDRAGAGSTLRPSVIPSLIRVHSRNCDSGVHDLKLFETAAVYHRRGAEHREEVVLALLAPFDEPDTGLRPLRGVAERLVHLLRGPDATVSVEASNDVPWLVPGARARVGGTDIGWLGVLDDAVVRGLGGEPPLLAAELTLPQLYAAYPPENEARPLPAYPAIERDLSVVVAEPVTWQQLHDAVTARPFDHMEGVEFVSVYRGRQVETGSKSMTMRARFRADDRTLTHDEVDPQVEAMIALLTDTLAATLRA